MSRVFSGSAGLLNMRRNSSFSTSTATLAFRLDGDQVASSPSSLDISNSSVLSGELTGESVEHQHPIFKGIFFSRG
jgi:hypothetical protein